MSVRFFADFSGLKSHAVAGTLPLPPGGGEGRGEGAVIAHVGRAELAAKRPLTLTLSPSEGERESKKLNWLLVLLCAALTSVAATNSESGDESLELLPPYAEMPPSFWEQHGGVVIAAAFLAIVALAFILWLLLRPRTPVVMPIEIQTRRELESLRQRTEDGQVLSQVSRAVRRYFATAFELSANELTTTELCRTVEASEKFSPELAAKVTVFLRRCDELKFSPASSPEKFGAAERGLELVNLGETRRALLHQSAAVPAAKAASQSA